MNGFSRNVSLQLGIFFFVFELKKNNKKFQQANETAICVCYKWICPRIKIQSALQQQSTVDHCPLIVFARISAAASNAAFIEKLDPITCSKSLQYVQLLTETSFHCQHSSLPALKNEHLKQGTLSEVILKYCLTNCAMDFNAVGCHFCY